MGSRIRRGISAIKIGAGEFPGVPVRQTGVLVKIKEEFLLLYGKCPSLFFVGQQRLLRRLMFWALFPIDFKSYGVKPVLIWYNVGSGQRVLFNDIGCGAQRA